MKIKAVLAALALAAAIPASAGVVYTNNFESNSNGFTGAGSLTATQGYGALGFGQQMLRNSSNGASSILNLNLDSALYSANLSLSLAVIDSWDGGNCCGPDYFNVRVDGQVLLSQNFDIFGVPAVSPNLKLLSFGNQLGFSGTWGDQAYGLSLNLGKLAAGAHTIEFFSSGVMWQAGDDESWAIDNLSISGERPLPPNDVPEPVTGALLLGGLGAMALARRRRRRA